MARKELIFIFLTIGVALGYDLGVLHKYSYDFSTDVDEECQFNAPKLVGQGLHTIVQLTAIWQNAEATQQLLKIEVKDAKLWVPKKNVLLEHPSELDQLSPKSSFILREKGSVANIWDDPTETPAIRNIKRGVASLLQIKDKNQEGREVSVAGDCQTIYEVKGENILKRKSNCVHSKFDRSLSQPYGVRSVSTQHLLSTDCKLSNKKSDVISQCTGSEYVKTFSNVWKKSSICVTSTSGLLLEGTTEGHKVFKNKDLESVIEELKKSSEGNLEKGDIEAVLDHQESTPQGNLEENLKRYQDSLKDENLAKLKSARAFYKLIPSFRSASKENIIKILQNKKFKNIQGQILDLIAASLKESSLEAAFEHFQDVTSYDETLERLLISLSISPRPNEYILKQIKSFLESKKRHEKIQATLISTLGAVLRTYRQHDAADRKILEEYRTYLEKKLVECSDESCEKSLLRGLRNAAFSQSTPLLLKYALKGGKQALEAVLAIRNVDIRLLPAEIQDGLLNVFLQVGGKQDRSTRSVAADILLDLHPDARILRGILASLSDQSDPEFATFLSAKIFQKTREDKGLRSSIFQLLPEKYISLSQKGSSSLFTKPLITSDGINVTYGIEMEMLPGNLMKRSVFDVNFEIPEVSNLLTVAMFGEGIASLAGGSSEDNADPTAGMELTLLGSSLRPYIFFTGTSQLMGHAWSGTASTPTPALQGIFSFSDDERVVVLHNGLIVQVQLRGVLSTDLSASVQISLWSQNSQSQVKNAAALLMRGSVTVDSGFSTVQGAFQLSGQSAIDFSTNLVFSESPFQMCLQMEHPDIEVKHDTFRSVNVKGSKYVLKRTKRRKREIPSRSYALHQTNNEQCRQLN